MMCLRKNAQERAKTQRNHTNRTLQITVQHYKFTAPIEILVIQFCVLKMAKCLEAPYKSAMLLVDLRRLCSLSHYY